MARALQSQTFTASGTFNVPANVSAVWITACGAGTGGNGYLSSTGNPSHGGGGAAEFCLSRMVPVTAGGTLPIVVGAGSAGAIGNGVSAAGGASQFGSFPILGGKTMRTGASYGGDGGGTLGGLSGSPSYLGGAESPSSWGGTAGLEHATSSGPPGGANSLPCAGAAGTGGGNVGTGGSALLWPSGGNGSPTSGTPAPSNATGWGAGGGGAAEGPTASGGNGANGAVVVHWIG